LEGDAYINNLIESKISEDLFDFLNENGIHDPSFFPIKSGRNSRVWRLEDVKCQWILKQYFRNVEDLRDRLGNEFSFLRLLHNNDIDIVPEPLDCNFEKGWGLYSMLPGKLVNSVTKNYINQAADFVVKVNNLRTIPEAQKIISASEACFSLKEHLELVRSRIKSLERIDQGSKIHIKVKELVYKKLLPSFEKICKSIQIKFSSTLEVRLATDEKILSPSDFGFHNILVDNNKLYFLDFEYAGWDDPAKLLCDFTCQPEREISQNLSKTFSKKITGDLGLSDSLLRSKEILPLYRLKWCCIFLNEFRNKDLLRRKFAGTESSNLLSRQLEKTCDYFHQYLEVD